MLAFQDHARAHGTDPGRPRTGVDEQFKKVFLPKTVNLPDQAYAAQMRDVPLPFSAPAPRAPTLESCELCLSLRTRVGGFQLQLTHKTKIWRPTPVSVCCDV